MRPGYQEPTKALWVPSPGLARLGAPFSAMPQLRVTETGLEPGGGVRCPVGLSRVLGRGDSELYSKWREVRNCSREGSGKGSAGVDWSEGMPWSGGTAGLFRWTVYRTRLGGGASWRS